MHGRTPWGVGRAQLRATAMGLVAVALLMAGLVTLASDMRAGAQGPAYNGPQTQSTGPAYFGPAPNPVPYCDSPTYFDPFPENVDPVGRLDITGSPNASVTTNGVTMDLTLTGEGDPGGQYPGFFPEGGDGIPNDQPKGIEMAAGDAAEIRLSEPLFYSQWVFTDVDQPSEGFTVEPQWTQVGQAAAFGGDEFFSFAGTTTAQVELDDTNGVGSVSESIDGRVQVDFLGAVTGIDITRTSPSHGQSGFAVGGGCVAAGAAKRVVAGPTWNGTAFEVTYELRLQNNLPSTATLQAAVAAAQARVGASLVTGGVQGVQGIPLVNLQLIDQLADPAFSDIEVTGVANPTAGLTLNGNYNGLSDDELLAPGAAIDAGTDELIVLEVAYTPDISSGSWNDCANGYDYLNQSRVDGSAANVAISDLSDDGVDAGPGADNGAGGVDDPTPVEFPCVPAGLRIVKTAVAGPGGSCPLFADGVAGPGTPLSRTVGETVTYCISVKNPALNTATDVEIADAQAPGDFSIGDLPGGRERTVSYDVVVSLATPTTNTAFAAGSGPAGPLPQVSDPAAITIVRLPDPVLEIVKTVVVGPGGTCPSFENGVAGLGDPLEVFFGSTVTYCISVRNSGAGDATDVEIVDEQAPAAPFLIGSMASGSTITRSYDLVVIAATPLVNVAAVSGTGPNGQVPPADDDARISTGPQPAPSIRLDHTVIDSARTCDTAVEGADELVVRTTGDPVRWCLEVTNTGNTPLINVSLVAAGIGFDDADVLATQGLAALAPLSSIVITVNATIPDNGLVSQATVTADPADDTGALPGLDPVTDSNNAAVDEAAIELQKQVVANGSGNCTGASELIRVAMGQAVTWCYTVTNTGNVVLLVTEVEDITLDFTAGIPAARQLLAPGESVTVAVSGMAPGAVKNTARVEGMPVDDDGDPFPGEPIVEDDDTAAIETVSADISIEKTVSNAGPVPRGSQLDYTLVIRNAGRDAADGIVVVDSLPAGLSYATLPGQDGWVCSSSATQNSFTCLKGAPLAAAGSATLTYKVTVGAGATAGVDLVNTATVGSSTPDPDESDNTDTARTRTSASTPPDEVIPRLEYPGPFTPPEAPPVAEPPDEVLGLAITGAASSQLALSSIVMLMIGGVLMVGARRSRRG